MANDIRMTEHEDGLPWLFHWSLNDATAGLLDLREVVGAEISVVDDLDKDDDYRWFVVVSLRGSRTVSILCGTRETAGQFLDFMMRQMRKCRRHE